MEKIVDYNPAPQLGFSIKTVPERNRHLDHLVVFSPYEYFQRNFKAKRVKLCIFYDFPLRKKNPDIGSLTLVRPRTARVASLEDIFRRMGQSSMPPSLTYRLPMAISASPSIIGATISGIDSADG